MPVKISYKLIIAVALVIVFFILGFAYYYITSQRGSLVSQVEHNAEQISETIKSSTKYDMLLDARDHIHRIIDEIGAQDSIEKIRVFNKEGTIIFSPDKNIIGQMVDKNAEACYRCHAQGQPLERLSVKEKARTFRDTNGKLTLGFINPIYNEPRCWQGPCHAHTEDQQILGVLDITMSLDHVEKQISENQMKILLFTIVVIVALSAIIWLLVYVLVGRPVGELVKATNIVASGDMSFKIKLNRKDELGNLAQSFNDMTDKLATAQRQIYQANKLASVGQLAAGVAHEINNPLTGILSYSEMVQEQLGEDSEYREDLDVVIRETIRCRDIVKKLLDFSRQTQPTFGETDLNDVIEQSVKLVQNHLTLNNITIIRDADAAMPTIMADKNQLKQVFINLLINASDAIGSDGKIRIANHVKSDSDREWIVVVFEDNGSGIAQENLINIFDPFFSTKGAKGTGLGLALVWGIINDHGGNINVESTLGKGTIFKITLPVRQANGYTNKHRV